MLQARLGQDCPASIVFAQGYQAIALSLYIFFTSILGVLYQATLLITQVLHQATFGIVAVHCRK